jgi:hypothetical protein
MLETSYILNLGKLLKIGPNLNMYLWKKLKLDKSQIHFPKTIQEKLVVPSILDKGITSFAISNHMVII